MQSSSRRQQRRRLVVMLVFLALVELLSLVHTGAAFSNPSWRRRLLLNVHQQQGKQVAACPFPCLTAKVSTTRISLHRKLPDLFGKSDDDDKKKKKNMEDKKDKSSEQDESSANGGSSSSRSSGSSSGSSSSNARLSQNVGGVMDSIGNFKNAQKVGQLTQNLVQDLSRTMSEGTAAEGRVRVVLDGQQRPVSVKIDASYFEVMLPSADGTGGSSSTDDASLFAEELSSAITAAMQRAHAKSVESIDEKMKSLYNELGIPSSK